MKKRDFNYAIWAGVAEFLLLIIVYSLTKIDYPVSDDNMFLVVLCTGFLILRLAVSVRYWYNRAYKDNRLATMWQTMSFISLPLPFILYERLNNEKIESSLGCAIYAIVFLAVIALFLAYHFYFK